jgi:hypothetical protein
MDVGLEIVILSGMTLVLLAAGAAMFSWNK